MTRGRKPGYKRSAEELAKQKVTREKMGPTPYPRKEEATNSEQYAGDADYVLARSQRKLPRFDPCG